MTRITQQTGGPGRMTVMVVGLLALAASWWAYGATVVDHDDNTSSSTVDLVSSTKLSWTYKPEKDRPARGL